MRAGPATGPLESPETGLTDETSLAEGERPGSAPPCARPATPTASAGPNREPSGRAWGVVVDASVLVDLLLRVVRRVLGRRASGGAGRESPRGHGHARPHADGRSPRTDDRHRPCGDRAQRRDRRRGPAALPRRPRAGAQRRTGTDHRRVHPRRRKQSHAGAGRRGAHQPGHDRTRGAAEHRARDDRAHRGREGAALGAVRHGRHRRRGQRHHAARRARGLVGRARLRRLRHAGGERERRLCDGAPRVRPRRLVARQCRLPDSHHRRHGARLRAT